MSKTKKPKHVHRVPQLSIAATASWGCEGLRQRLEDIQRRRLPSAPEVQPMRIGVEDPHGDLAQVVETTRLIEAVKVFETLADFGLVPNHGRCRASDGRTLVRTYRQPRHGWRSSATTPS